MMDRYRIRQAARPQGNPHRTPGALARDRPPTQAVSTVRPAGRFKIETLPSRICARAQIPERTNKIPGWWTICTARSRSSAGCGFLDTMNPNFPEVTASKEPGAVHAPPYRRGGQAQYVETPLSTRAEAGDQLAATLEWAMQRLGQPLPVKVLAAHCALSPRHFTRQFRDATGTTPHQWLLTQRLALAQRLLETTDQPIDHIAASAGFGTPAAMRLQFQQALDTSPAAYRRTFRTPAPSAA